MLPLPGNQTGMIGIFEYTNLITNGWFIPLTIFSFFILTFIAMKQLKYETPRIMLMSGFFSFFLSLLVWGAGLLSGKMLLLIFAVFIASAIWDYTS